MTLPRLVLVTGSRALAGVVAARQWVDDRLGALTPAVLVTGDACGPDAWAASWARRHKSWCRLHLTSDPNPLRRYDLRGRITDTDDRTTGAWTTAEPPADDAVRALWGAWCLHRDRVMVRHVARRADRYAVTVLALTSRSSDTKGTAFTVGRAKAAGLVVVAEAWP